MLKISLFALLWIAILGALFLLNTGVEGRRAALRVSNVAINRVDSASNGNLITHEMVERMLSRERIDLGGKMVRDVELTRVENVISRNGFVKSVAAYIDYSGVVNIDIRQRSAVARLLFDGYNCYITQDGFVFDAPTTTALNTPVVTGSYRPLFAPGFSGYIKNCMVAKVAELEREKERVEREKYPIYLRESENTERRREVRRRYINQKMFESDVDFDRRVEALREENREKRERYAAVQRKIDAELKTLEQRQERYCEEQKKVEKKCEDIENLITFVEIVERDSFWGSEIVQIDLHQGERGEMKVQMAVRSGKFIVTLGNIPSSRSEIHDRLSRLREFYDEALPRVGWDRYKEINIEYKNQVICKR